MNEERKIETEEVEAVTPPPRARVTPETSSASATISPASSPGEKPEEPKGGAGSDLQATVVEALKSIYDPEIPVDIYELGLIYDVDDQRGRRRDRHHDPDHAALPGRGIAAAARSSCACCRCPASATPWSTWCGTRRGTRRR